jgi:protein Tex
MRPSPPPPPLSKDALAGNVPLRTFGQLKQLWEAKVEPKDESPGSAGNAPEPAPGRQHGSVEAPVVPEQPSDTASNPSAAPVETDPPGASS